MILSGLVMLIRLNPFEVREVLQESYDEMNDDFIRLNPFEVREVLQGKTLHDACAIMSQSL